MNRNTRAWIEGRLRVVNGRVVDDSGKVIAEPAPDDGDVAEPGTSRIRRVIGRIRRLLGQ